VNGTRRQVSDPRGTTQERVIEHVFPVTQGDLDRLRDDSKLRILRMATQAREELELEADSIDWERLYSEAAEELAQDRSEAQINWKTLVKKCIKGHSH
jgi:hypothetical protein